MLLTLMLAGCGGSPVDSGACASVATPGWDGWARGFFTTWCQGCHASGAGDRHGAPEGVVFDTEAEARAQAARIRARVLEQQDMPVGGGVYPDELARLEAWLDCSADSEGGGPEPPTATFTPSWSVEQALVELQAALDAPLIDPQATWDAYHEVLGHREAACPDTETLDMPPEEGGCQTSGGWTFAGPSLVTDVQEVGRVERLLWCDCEILGPDGERFAGAGNIGYELLAETGGVRFGYKQNAAYSWSEGEGWLAGGNSAIVIASGYGDRDRFELEIDATASLEGRSVAWRGVQVDSASCPNGVGELRLRDPAGGWYALDLGSACEGCGALSFEGEALGEGCVDLNGPARAVVNAMGRP